MSKYTQIKLALDYNPYHGEGGRFTSGEGGGGKGVTSVSISNKVAVEKMKAQHATKQAAHNEKVSNKATAKGEKSKAVEAKKTLEKPKVPETHNIVKPFSNYNPNSWSKPWGSVIRSLTEKGGLNHEFEGSHHPDMKAPTYANHNVPGFGSKGETHLKAKTGEIVAFGQKNLKNSTKSEMSLYKVGSKGELEPISRADAIEHIKNSK